MFFALKGDNFDGNTFTKEAIARGAKFVVIDNPQFQEEPYTILVDNVLKTLQQLASFHRDYLGLKIIALTGSNGKTTTKELINVVLSTTYKTSATIGNLNNHIGVPLTLLSMTKDTEIGIVEMGANHQKEIELLCSIAKPDFGYITNFGKAHLEGFGGIEGVIKGKSEMYTYLISNDKSIFINSDDPTQVEKTSEGETIRFGTKPDNESIITLVKADPFVEVKFMDTIIQSNLIGAYNFGNISAATAIGNYFHVPVSQIKKAIEGYIPDNNRSQIINKGTTKIILDAYNANPSSMTAALQNLDKQNHPNRMIVLGDMFELGDAAYTEHQSIRNLVESLDFNVKILIGENFYKTKNNTSTIDYFKSFTDFREASEKYDFENTLILIKGSRGMALERVLDLWN